MIVNDLNKKKKNDVFVLSANRPYDHTSKTNLCRSIKEDDEKQCLALIIRLEFIHTCGPRTSNHYLCNYTLHDLILYIGIFFAKF